MKSYVDMNLWYDVIKVTLHLWLSSQKAHGPNLIMKKVTDISQLMAILQNTWPVFFKILKVIKNKKSNKLSHLRGDYYDYVIC